ncbi:MAG TPA: rod shape-determining protein MreD [Mycobacteriales bacterium]
MTGRRHVLAAVLVITALLLQLVLVNGLGLPGGPPNLVLAVVLALALVDGPGPGMAYGFAGGLLGDALSSHAFGRLALAWTVACYLAGLVAPSGRLGGRSLAVPVAATGVLSGLATLGFAALAVVAGSAHEASTRIVVQAVAVSIYGAIMAPFVYLFVRFLLGRLEVARA